MNQFIPAGVNNIGNLQFISCHLLEKNSFTPDKTEQKTKMKISDEKISNGQHLVIKIIN